MDIVTGRILDKNRPPPEILPAQVLPVDDVTEPGPLLASPSVLDAAALSLPDASIASRWAVSTAHYALAIFLRTVCRMPPLR